ncbi:MAG: DUF4286 family protein [Bacteroidia bacterium]
MIIYNVTVQVEDEIKEDWLKWMQEKHIPAVMATGRFREHRIFEMLTHKQAGHQAYAIQYVAKSMEDYEEYQRDYAPTLQQEHRDRYGDSAIGFRTLMKQL